MNIELLLSKFAVKLDTELRTHTVLQWQLALIRKVRLPTLIVT